MRTANIKEWIGRTDNSAVPPRVRLRVFERDKGACQCGCTIKIRPGDKWETDHIVALANGGKNQESNLRTMLVNHHRIKTASDVAEKATTYRKRAKHLGIRKPSRLQSAGFRKAAPQRTASRPIQKGA